MSFVKMCYIMPTTILPHNIGKESYSSGSVKATTFKN